MGYRVAKEKDRADEHRSGGIPGMYLQMAKMNLAEKVRDRGCVIDRHHYAKELGLPVGHEDVYRAAYKDAGLLDEFLAEAERLRKTKIGTKYYKPPKGGR